MCWGYFKCCSTQFTEKEIRRQKTNEKSPVEPLKSIAVVNPLGTGEVFPVEEDEQAAKKSQGDGDDKKGQDCLV